MKVILVTPHYHQSRGNTVTVNRISRNLNHLGVRTEIIPITEDDDFRQLPPADLVHGFNAYQFSKFLRFRESMPYPYLVTLTGTDLNYALVNENTRAPVIKTLNNSEAIHVFNKEARNLLWQEVPGLKNKTFLVPQGIHQFTTGQGSIRKEEGSFIFLLPAGIRRVKNVPAAISLLSPLHKKNSELRLWIVGPIIEKDEGTKVLHLIKENARWVRYLGEWSHSNMGELYRQADVVLNTSLSEGQSAAILEAMAMGAPVLVSKVTGNRDIVRHGSTGFLYRDEKQFHNYAQQLMEDEGLRKSMGFKGKKYVTDYHSEEKEAQTLRTIYSQILQNKSVSYIPKIL